MLYADLEIQAGDSRFPQAPHAGAAKPACQDAVGQYDEDYAQGRIRESMPSADSITSLSDGFQAIEMEEEKNAAERCLEIIKEGSMSVLLHYLHAHASF